MSFISSWTGSNPATATNFKEMQAVSCKQLKKFMKTQLEVVSRHLDEHKYLRKIEDKEVALSSIITDYGWLFRELYCTHVCSERNNCEIAKHLMQHGDLLKDRIK